jgi:SAM-dependent methyltransferase
MEILTEKTDIQDTRQVLSPTVNRRCLLCGSNEKRVAYAARVPEISASATSKVMHYQYASSAVSNSWHYRVVECAKCAHKFADPIFSRSVVESSYLLQDHDNEFGLDMDLLRQTNLGYAELVRPVLAEKRDLQVDIGCDTGIFLEQSAGLGFERRVGIEPGPDSAKKASELPGVEIKQKIFDESDFAPKSIDFVSLVHVLDHIVDPRQLIRNVHSRLKDGGVILAVVHNIDSLVAKISGESWAVLNLVHMDYFTKRTLRKLFELEGYNVHFVAGTKNYFPLHHLIRFAPFVPSFLRGRLVRIAKMRPFNRLVLGLRLGNIAVVATPRR